MRLIYVDEAGTSAKEPVRVVCGVIVEPDSQYDATLQVMRDLFDKYVPSIYRDGFIFHAKEVFSGGKNIDRDVWPFKDRLLFFKDFLGIYRTQNLPISLGICFRGKLDEKRFSDKGVTQAQIFSLEHCIAMGSCAAKADSFVQKYLNLSEKSYLVAEDLPERKSILGKAAVLYRANPIEFTPEMLEPSALEKALNIKPAVTSLGIKSIIDEAVFVPASAAPLLQLADAAAFTFRRVLAEQSHGADLLISMLDQEGAEFLQDRRWWGGFSSGLFNTHHYWSDEHWDNHFHQFLLSMAVGSGVNKA